MKVAWDSYFWQLAGGEGRKGCAVTVLVDLACMDIRTPFPSIPPSANKPMWSLLTCTVARGP